MAIDIASTTKAPGIFQSDVLIRTAIIQGFADIRANPWLLDYCFAWLAQDDMTKAQYGKAQIKQAKDWFLRHEIEVQIDLQLHKAEFPTVTISLLSSVEEETTLADVDPEVEEDADQEWPILAGPLTPVSVDVTTGKMDLPDVGGLVLAAGMVIVTRAGKAYTIIDIDPEVDGRVFLAAGQFDDFTDATIRGCQAPAQRIALEGSWFAEQYRIGVHAQGESVHLLYLDSVVRFVLLRYRQRFLEARGFESSTISANDASKNEQQDPEILYSRFMVVSGRVRNFWPKDLMEKFASVGVQLAVIGSDKVPGSDIPPGKKVDDLAWIGDNDALGG